MNKHKILIEIQNGAGKISTHWACKACTPFLGISDALALFPHCKNTQRDTREALNSHKKHNCIQHNKNIQALCQWRRNLIEKFLDLCEKK